MVQSTVTWACGKARPNGNASLILACQDGPVPHPTVPVYFAALPRIKTGGSNQQRAPQQHITRRSSRCCRPLLARHRGRAAQPPVSRAAQAPRPGSSTEDARRLAAGLQAARAVAPAPPSLRADRLRKSNRRRPRRKIDERWGANIVLSPIRWLRPARLAIAAEADPTGRNNDADWRLADGRGSGGHGGESDGQTQDPVGRHPYRGLLIRFVLCSVSISSPWSRLALGRLRAST